MSCSAHAYTPPVRPETCVCDPLTWIKPSAVPPVCSEYKEHDGYFNSRFCQTCDHDFECHKVPA